VSPDQDPRPTDVTWIDRDRFGNANGFGTTERESLPPFTCALTGDRYLKAVVSDPVGDPVNFVGIDGRDRGTHR
jgi:hypothetical protein